MNALKELPSAEMETTCGHEQTRLTKFVKSNNTTCVRVQCQRCGAALKEVSKRDHNIDELPLFDESLRDEWNDMQRSSWRQAYQVKQEILIEESEQWWEAYGEYLRSRQWHDMRQLVLKRDGHICQACLRNKATQVHHISYKIYNQLGRSAAFELIAICLQCHRTIHPHMADMQAALAEQIYNPYLNGGNNGYKHGV